jgi:glycyl-tRNA synthetase alpha subunit
MESFGIFPSGGILCDWEVEANAMQLPAYGRHSRAGCLANHIARKAAIYGAKRLAIALQEQSKLAEKAQQAHDEWAVDHNDEDKTSIYFAATTACKQSNRQLTQFLDFIEAQ